MKRSFAVVFGGIFTFLISLTILFAGMDLELKPTRENKTPVGSFDDSFIRSNSAPSIIRTLTVTPQLKPKERIDNKTINHSTDLASIWGPDKSLSISGFQNVDSVGYFSVSIFGTVIVDTESQNGKKPSPTPEGWEFAGTGNYNIKYCTFSNISNIKTPSLTQNEINAGSQIKVVDIEITKSASSTVRDLVKEIYEISLKNELFASFEHKIDYNSDTNHGEGLLCNICKNNTREFDEVNEDIILSPPNMYLPKIKILNGSMGPETAKAFQEFFDGRRNHEMVHYNNYISLLGKLKKLYAKFEGCSTTLNRKNYNELVIKYTKETSDYYEERIAILNKNYADDEKYDNDSETIEATKNAFKPFENIADSKIFE